MTTTAFDAALAGRTARMVRSDGGEIGLAVGRWLGPAAGADCWLLDRCHGPALDLGCGPGRLLVALRARGIPALGIDLSPAAVAGCRRRRVPVLHRDVLGPLPDEGRWAHVLLADGNIGIGGDPQRLLGRARALLRPGGTVLVETDPRPDTRWAGTVTLIPGTLITGTPGPDTLVPDTLITGKPVPDTLVAGALDPGAQLPNGQLPNGQLPNGPAPDGPVPNTPVADALAAGGVDTSRPGAALPWATLGTGALVEPAARAGLRITDRYDGERSFVELSAVGPRARPARSAG